MGKYDDFDAQKIAILLLSKCAPEIMSIRWAAGNCTEWLLMFSQRSVDSFFFSDKKKQSPTEDLPVNSTEILLLDIHAKIRQVAERG